MSYASWSVVFGEQPSAAKWNILGTNDSSFNDGTGISNLEIGSGHTSLKNDYKFAAYRNSAWTTGNNAYALVTFDTKVFDTGTNYDTATGKFTAPVTGFYCFNTVIGQFVTTAGDFYKVAIYKNGSIYNTLWTIRNSSGGQQQLGGGSTLMSLVATDYVQIFGFSDGANVGSTGATETWFNGYLLSQT